MAGRAIEGRERRTRRRSEGKWKETREESVVMEMKRRGRKEGRREESEGEGWNGRREEARRGRVNKEMLEVARKEGSEGGGME